MEFEFIGKSVIENYGQWNTSASAWKALDSLLNKLDRKYRKHTKSEGSPYRLNPDGGYEGLYWIGERLIINAKDSINIKGAHEGAYLGKIEVNVSASNEQVRVTIEDNGVGIHPEIEPYLFTRLENAAIPPNLFKRKMKEEIAQISGMCGEDLMRIRENVEGLGGKVFYENKGYNVGAIFGYEVPISSISVPQAPSSISSIIARFLN